MTDETRLSQELSRRAQDLHTDPITLEEVRGRARSIRRRRAAGTAVAVAVVAAIVVPISLLAGGSGNQSDLDPAPSPTPTHAIDPPDQGLPVLHDGVIIYLDGPRIPLQLEPDQTVDGFATLGTDRHVLSVQTGDGGREAVVVDEFGSPTATYPLNGGLAVLPYDGAVAWMNPDGSPMLLRADSAEPQVLTPVPGSDPTAVAVSGDCDQICRVMVRVKDGDNGGLGTSWEVDTNGGVLRSDVPAVVDVSPAGGVIAGLDSYAPDDVHICGGVFDLGPERFLFHNCEDNVYDFSPDGSLVATTFGEGLGPNHVSLRDAHSGTVVGGLADRGWIPSMAWDGEHLLVVVVAEDGATSLERIGLEGDPETVLEGYMTSMDDLRPALILPTLA